jgi:hypothetical protein
MHSEAGLTIQHPKVPEYSVVHWFWKLEIHGNCFRSVIDSSGLFNLQARVSKDVVPFWLLTERAISHGYFKVRFVQLNFQLDKSDFERQLQPSPFQGLSIRFMIHWSGYVICQLSAQQIPQPHCFPPLSCHMSFLNPKFGQAVTEHA